MKRAAAALLFLGLAHGTARAFVIKEFNIKLEPNVSDSSFLITEKFTLDYGQEVRHGLAREIPIKYNRNGVVVDAEFNLRRAYADHSDRFAEKREGRKVIIRIGDADKTVSGVHSYTIQYTVGRAMLFFDDHDEIYWNATGSEWLAEIERAEFRLVLPAGVKAGSVRTQGYTGPAGARGTDYRITEKDGALVWTTTRPLGLLNGMTIVAGFPKGTFHAPPLPKITAYAPSPGLFDDIMPDLEMDRTAAVTAAAVFTAAAFGLLALWRTVGRDPDDDAPIAVEFEVPADMSPAEAGTLIDERADKEDVIATLFDLAARGFIKVVHKGAEYTFQKLSKQADLRPHEVKFLDALFGTSVVTTLADSRERFAKTLSDQESMLYRLMEQKGYFPVRPDVVRTGYITAGTMGFLGAIGMNILADGAGHPSAAAGLLWGGMSGSVLFLLCAPFMPKKSPEGARIARRLEGFKEFVRRVEKERLAALLAKDPDIFEKVLPYAIALGVGKEWAARFEGLMVAPPEYYEGDLADFNPSLWYDNVSSSSNRLTFHPSASSSDWSSTPDRDSWSSGSDWGSSSGFSSGGSSGSSSGGSSGGGGGGGGGGAW